MVNAALASLDEEFDKLYADTGRDSIPPERLLRAALLQVFFSIRSERLLMEQLDYNLLYSWFVGGSVWMMRCGTTRCSPRTATGCSMPTWRPNFWLQCWPIPR